MEFGRPRRGAAAAPAPVGRLARAQANFFETFPIAAAAILLLAVTGRWDRLTEIGALLGLAARIVYLPLYAAGAPLVRTAVWLASIIGIALLLRPLILP